MVADLEEGLRGEDVLPTGRGVAQPWGQPPAQGVGHGVGARQREHPRGRALEHRHVRAALGQRGHERDGRGTAADDDDPAACDVEVRRPRLRVHDRAPERGQAGDVGRVAVVVAVVAAAQVQEGAGPALGRALGRADLDGPALPGGRPGRRDDPVPEPDVAVDPELGGGLLQVAQDRVTVGDGLGLGPRPERVAEGEHVRVRADAREAEQVPGAPDGVTGLEDRERAPRMRGLQPMGGPDAREARSDDQDVHIVHAATVIRGGPNPS